MSLKRFDAWMSECLPKSGLLRALPLTILAPTDAAFERLNQTQLEALSPEQRLRIFKYHVVPGARRVASLKEPCHLNTAADDKLCLNMRGQEVMLNDAKIIRGSCDVEGPNGIVHVLDRVLLPAGMHIDVVDASHHHHPSRKPPAYSMTVFSELLDRVPAALQQGSVTILAPTDAAMARVDLDGISDADAQSLVRNHILPGIVPDAELHSVQHRHYETLLKPETVCVHQRNGDTYVNGALVIKGRSMSRDGEGVVHVLDRVLVPSTLDLKHAR